MDATTSSFLLPSNVRDGRGSLRECRGIDSRAEGLGARPSVKTHRQLPFAGSWGPSYGQGMKLDRLLSTARFGNADPSPTPVEHDRDAFERDLDRIVFSESFRRLQNKTQVHSLSINDHVRNRLTHSIEVGSVARSLGTRVGRWLQEEGHSGQEPQRVGNIVQAAGLAHDIGNPPFGHAGEEAIRNWFRGWFGSGNASELLPEQKADFLHFEGNAQGFRILTRLENHRDRGGLQLTYATLGTFTKYPTAAAHIAPAGPVASRKNGFFSQEAAYFAEVASHCDMGTSTGARNVYARHPLSYLMEAADDICYHLADIEDGVELHLIHPTEAMDAYRSLSQTGGQEANSLSGLRAQATTTLVRAVYEAFVNHFQELIDGTMFTPLTHLTPYREGLLALKDLARVRIFESEAKLRTELAGQQAVEGLLERFVPAVHAFVEDRSGAGSSEERTKKLLRLIDKELNRLQSTQNMYEALLLVTDFVSGMTDRYAVELYRTLQGVRL